MPMKIGPMSTAHGYGNSGTSPPACECEFLWFASAFRGLSGCSAFVHQVNEQSVSYAYTRHIVIMYARLSKRSTAQCSTAIFKHNDIMYIGSRLKTKVYVYMHVCTSNDTNSPKILYLQYPSPALNPMTIERERMNASISHIDQTRTFSNACCRTSSLVLCISSDALLLFRINSSICTTSFLHFEKSASWTLTSEESGTERRRAIVS